MNASARLNRPASDPEAEHVRATSRRIALAQPLRKGGKESKTLEARIKSLKILALTLLREIEYLEGQDATAAGPRTLDLRAEIQRFEEEMIRSALMKTGGRQRPAARLLGMKATTLNSKVRRYQIETKEMTL